MSLQTGSPAPLFSLYASDKSLVELEKLRGKKVVLLFFPLAFTGTCTKELCMVRDGLSEFDNRKATVFGISVDSLHALARFRESLDLQYQLLADFNKEVSKAYQCFYEEFSYGMKGVSKRAAFVIDENGIVRYADVLENAGDIPDFRAVYEVLDQI